MALSQEQTDFLNLIAEREKALEKYEASLNNISFSDELVIAKHWHTLLNLRRSTLCNFMDIEDLARLLPDLEDVSEEECINV